MSVQTYSILNLTNGNLVITSLNITLRVGQTLQVLTLTPEMVNMQNNGQLSINAAINSNDAAFSGIIPMPTDGGIYAAGRSIQAICSAAGNVQFTMTDGTTNIVPLNVGINIYSYAVTSWTVGGVSGAATATYSNLK